MNRKVVVVVGPDRCGTSLLAQFLHLLGVEMGDQLLPANASNEDGYWEHEPIIRAQDKILIALGRWHRTNLLPLPNAWWRKPEIKPHVDELRAIIEKNNSSFKGTWGFKDPRTARLLPLWQQLFQEYALEPVYILAVRNPGSAVDSFVKRNQYSPAVSEMIWTVHMTDAISHTDGSVHVVHYERWFSDALTQLGMLLDALGLKWPGEAWELEDAVARIVKSALNHNSNPIHAIRNPTTLELYGLLQKSGPDGKLLPEALDLAKSFRENQRQIAAWGEQFDAFWNLLTERLGDYFPNVWREMKAKPYVQLRADWEHAQQRSKDSAEKEQLQDVLNRLNVVENLHALKHKRINALEEQLHAASARIKELELLRAEALSRVANLDVGFRRLEETQRQSMATREYDSDQRPIDKIMPRHADYATATFPSFASVLESADLTFRKLKICILTRDIFGPVRNGGIGTAWGHAATFLAAQGHDVTIAYVLGNICENGRLEDWIAYYKNLGITFEPIPDPDIPSFQGFLSGGLRLTRKAYEHLKNSNYDIIHVSEWSGDGFMCLLAKKLGLAFQNTLICVKTSSPTHWNLQGNNALVQDKQQLLRAYIERKSVEYADIVISPSHHMLRWMMEWGYDLPRDRCLVQPNIMPAPANWSQLDMSRPGRLDEVREFVFFGRLEPRKGIEIFCRALELLSTRRKISVKITFLGKPAQNFDGLGYIAEQSKKWGCEYDVITTLNAQEAINYLSKEGRLAVVPSLLDNSPFTIYECLSARVPFLTTDRGGTPELVCEEDRPEVIFDPLPQRLADLLDRCLDHGAPIARPSFDFEKNLDSWAKFHLAIGNGKRLGTPKDYSTPAGSMDEMPLVSVCFAHFNRPQMLEQALESIKVQTYRNFEVIVVDDGSTLPEAKAYLDSLEPEFASKGWRIVRQENKYLGAVRNTGARHARGEYLLLMDDDNIAKPHEIETFVRVAQHSKADILTCFSDTFKNPEQVSNVTPGGRITFLGDNLSLGLFLNCFGDSNSFIRRSAFEAMGGFSEDYGVGHDDHEFFVRAVIQGFKLYVIPEALYWYRISAVRMRHNHFHQGSHAGLLRAFRPYFKSVPLCVHEALRFAQGGETLIGSMTPIAKAAINIKADFEKLKKLIRN